MWKCGWSPSNPAAAGGLPGLPAGEAIPSRQANTGGRHPQRPDHLSSCCRRDVTDAVMYIFIHYTLSLTWGQA